MPKRTKKEEKNITRLANVRPWFVSLVDYGANHGGKDHHFALKRADAVEKRVPDKDATDEDKQAALKERSDSYGIEIRDDAALTYPADFPTKEALYSDPVNLKYPVGDALNNIDLGRVRNALARFKQSHEEYSEETSRARVYERIVRAALDNGVEVTFDPEDPVDKLLPADLKDELQKACDDKKNEETKKALDVLELKAELAGLSAKLAAKSDPEPVPTPEPPPTIDEVAALHATVKAAEETIEKLKKENASLVGEVKTLRNKLTTEIAKVSRLKKSGATNLAGMHPVGDEVNEKKAGPYQYKDRYTGGN